VRLPARVHHLLHPRVHSLVPLLVTPSSSSAPLAAPSSSAHLAAPSSSAPLAANTSSSSPLQHPAPAVGDFPPYGEALTQTTTAGGSGMDGEAPPAGAEVRSVTAEMAAPTKRKLKVVACDDDDLCLLVLESLLRAMNADMEISSVLGTTSEEQDAVVDIVLGRRSPTLEALPSASLLPPADIVILDQNIDLQGQERLKGTGIAAELRQERFDGLIVLHTGASKQQAAQLTQHPALDAVFIKGEPPRVVATDILAAYHRRLSADRLSADQQAVRLM